jgi:replication-associated recombination protein RarA
VALKSSPFVLLFGPSGQGKTEVARLFAQALTAPRLM